MLNPIDSADENCATHLLLPDGSQLRLQSGFIIQSPSSFQNPERMINFYGEGFFDIAAHSESLFTILSGNLRIETRGAQFWIKTNKGETFVIVVRGMVKITQEKSFAVMAPRQQLSLRPEGIFHLSHGLSITDSAFN